MKTLKIYEYKNCDTCRKALKFLEKNGVAFEAVPIVEQPPTKAELKAMLKNLDGDLKRLFNTSGQQYRELGMSEKLPKMSEDDALSLLAKNGKLVKRPFVVGGSWLVGFREAEWKKEFSGK